MRIAHVRYGPLEAGVLELAASIIALALDDSTCDDAQSVEVAVDRPLICKGEELEAWMGFEPMDVSFAD
jgi:hypothetical protein